MREGISVTVIFQIVILFILLFTAIMALTINNTNAYGVKDKIIHIIENNDGNYLNDTKTGLSDEIVNAITEISYRTTGKCPTEDSAGNTLNPKYKGYSRDGKEVNSGEEASICIRAVSATDNLNSYLTNNAGAADDDFVTGTYYQIVVFYHLDLPVITYAYDFTVKGETKTIYK